MSEESSEKSALVPRRRFPQFSEAWRADRVGKIAEIFKGKGIAKSDISNDGIYSCIRYGELYTVYGELVTKVLSRTSLPATELFFGEPNDVIIPSSGETKEDIATAACVIPGSIAFGGDLNVLRTKENGAFLSYYLNGPLRKNIARVAQGDSVVHLYPHQIEKLPIAVPARNEQKKIADCLSSLDELITAETQKLDALKTHKKGLMQQLFPREGETVPRLRFPEFREAGEWEEKHIGEKLDLLSGFPFDGTDIGEDPSGVPLMRGINITEGFIRHNQDIDRFFCGSSAELAKYRLIEHDLVIGMDGSKVGKNSALVTDADAGALLVQRVARLRSGCETTIRFVFQHINSNIFHTYVDRINTSGGIPHISLKQISDFKICFPETREQQRIADCLSSLDDLIAAQIQKIDALKTHKKGLMQQLFPVLDEVPA